MDPTALAALLEAQERRHQESLTAMMERMHGLFLEANRGREPAAQPAVPLPRVRVVKMSLEDDPEAYLVAFERQATAAQWPREWWATQLGPNLIGEAQAAYQALTHEQALVYDQVKQAILQRLDITEETHRRRFREYQRPPGLRPRVVAQQLVDHVTRWLCPGTNDDDQSDWPKDTRTPCLPLQWSPYLLLPPIGREQRHHHHHASPPPPTDQHCSVTPWAASLQHSGERGRPPAG